MRTTHVLCIAMALLVVPTLALGDSITPGQTVYLNYGQSKTIDKTITMSAADVGKVDVFFLVETTSSMAGVLAAISSQASAIVDKLETSGFGDVRYGVGRYSDFPDGTFGFPETYVNPSLTVPTDIPYEQLLDVSAGTAAAAKLALPNVTVDVPSGGDGPESSLYALRQVAETTSWRTGAAKVILWFGDSPGHDPELEANENPPYPDPDPDAPPDPYEFTTSQQVVLDTLSAYGIIVEGISIGDDGGLNAPAVSANGYKYLAGHNQGTEICTGTGGDLMTMVDTSTSYADQIVTAIFNAVTTGFLKYHTVDLDVSELQKAELTTTYTPPGGYTEPTGGGWDRSVERTFDFQVTFTAGFNDATYTGPVWGVIDGGKLLPEIDKIIIGKGGPGPEIPEPSTMILMGLGLAGLGFAARRKLRK